MNVPAADNLRYLSQFRLYSTRTAMVEAATLLEAIDALHQPVVQYPDMDDPLVPFVACEHCGDAYPCATARLLHPDTPA